MSRQQLSPLADDGIELGEREDAMDAMDAVDAVEDGEQHKFRSAIFRLSVPREKFESGALVEWLDGIGWACASFPGYLGRSKIYPPADALKVAKPRSLLSCVVIINFDTTAHLRGWLESDERRRWMSRAARRGVIAAFAEKEARGLVVDVEAAESSATRVSVPPPPKYRLCLLITACVSVVVRFLAWAAAPPQWAASDVPPAVSLFVTLALVVPLLTYGLLPLLGEVGGAVGGAVVDGEQDAER